MTTAEHDHTNCSVISFIKKGYEIIRQSVTKKSIQLDDESTVSEVPGVDTSASLVGRSFGHAGSVDDVVAEDFKSKIIRQPYNVCIVVWYDEFS